MHSPPLQAARLVRSPEALADWLRAADVAGRKQAAISNLDRAITLTPGDWTLYALRAELVDPTRAVADEDEAIRLGAESTVIVQMIKRAAPRAKQPADWARVAALLAAAAKDPALPAEDRYHLAVACLKAGDRAGYKAACAGIAGRMPPAGTPLLLGDAIAAANAFALGAGATEDWSVPLSWADRVLTRLAEREAADPSQKERNKPLRRHFLHVRGALLYRAGRFEEAGRTLREAMNLPPFNSGGEFANWVFLALAEYRLGHADAAKEAAARARTAEPKPNGAWEKAEVELLAAELDAAMPREIAPPPRVKR